MSEQGNWQQSPEVQAQLREVAFGMDVKAFIHSPIGQYLLKRAADERDEALEGLVNVDPTAADKIRDLQSTVRRAENFHVWLEEAVNTGQATEQQLINGD